MGSGKKGDDNLATLLLNRWKSKLHCIGTPIFSGYLGTPNRTQDDA